VKTIGLIGGMSWESSALYYRLINEETARLAGGHHNARSVMVTVDFAEVEHLQHAGEWVRLGEMLAESARSLELAGADFIVLCTNTMHKLADAITGAVKIPLLHIVDATGEAIRADGHKRVGLLATRFTMEEGFYRDRLREHFGIEAVIPGAESRELVHRIIYDEQCLGTIRPESRARLQDVIAALTGAGATAVILGCTEIELLISAADSSLPIFASAKLHACAAAQRALGS
jgi:aspartate racemase